MDDRVELRQAKATDAAAIRELTRTAYAKWVPLIGREPKPMTANYEEAVAALAVAFVSVMSESEHRIFLLECFRCVQDIS